MPTITASVLEALAKDLMHAAGASETEAAVIARHLIEANLAGHDSHGVINISMYIDFMKKGHMIPGAEFEILEESATTTVIDGHWGYGFSTSERAMEMTIEKARKYRVAATTVRHQGHIGRVADYPLMAAKAGMIGLMTADSGRAAKSVAPFGGRVPRLGTNPICIAMPSNLEGPVLSGHLHRCSRGWKTVRCRGARRAGSFGLGHRRRRQLEYESTGSERGRGATPTRGV